MMSQSDSEVTEVFRLDKICRLCLNEKNSMLRIFATKNRDNVIPLPIRIMSCAALEVYEGDGLPDRICQKCLHCVNQAYAFRQQCENSYTKLLKFVNSMKILSNFTSNVKSDNENMDAQNQLVYLNAHEPPNVEPSKVKVEPKNADSKIKLESLEDDDEDNQPISKLLKVKKPDGSTDKEDFNGEKQETDSDDNDSEPVASLVITEMPRSPAKFELDNSDGEGKKEPMNVRRFLENEFGSDPTYSTHRKFVMMGGDYKAKKRTRTANYKTEEASPSWANSGLDLPRRKYAPRDKNLISNNSSPILEQDGSKSKFRACIHCGKVVLGKNMGIHVKIHVGNKTHLCDICGKSFLYKKTLETHKRVHSGERPCVCKVCNKTFRSSSRLSDHMSTHTGKKPFICEICAVAFRIKGHLKKHLRVHSGEKPYICHFCEKAFSDAWNMKCHLRIHTGEKPPHACPVCAQCFLRRNKMEEHCKLTHGEEYVLPRKQAVIQRLKNDLVERSEELRAITQHEQETAIRLETERQLMQSHLEQHRLQQQQPADHHHHHLAQHESYADHMATTLSVPMPPPINMPPLPVPMPVPAFPGNLPAGIFGLQ